MRREQFSFLANFGPHRNDMQIVPATEILDKIEHPVLFAPQFQFSEAQFSGNFPDRQAEHHRIGSAIESRLGGRASPAASGQIQYSTSVEDVANHGSSFHSEAQISSSR